DGVADEGDVTTAIYRYATRQLQILEDHASGAVDGHRSHDSASPIWRPEDQHAGVGHIHSGRTGVIPGIDEDYVARIEVVLIENLLDGRLRCVLGESVVGT